MASPTVDRLKPVPLYRQLKDLLQDRVQTSEWLPGARMPTEKQLAADYGVSVITVRQALARLAAEGLVERYPGRGTFVAEPSVADDIVQLAGFCEEYLRPGTAVEPRLVTADIVLANGSLAERLATDQGDRLVRVAHVWLAGDTPLGLRTSYVPYYLGGTVLNWNLETESLSRLLAEVCGLEFSRAEEEVSAIATADHEAEILGVAPGSPAVLVQRTAFDLEDRPIEFVTLVLRGDKCGLFLTLDLEHEANRGPRVGLQVRIAEPG